MIADLAKRDPGPRGWRLGIVVAIVAVVAAYFPSLSGDWLWCDDYTVADNTALRSPDALARIATPGEFEQFYPVTHFVYWSGLRLFGASPLFFRVLSLALHASAAALLGALAGRLRLPGGAVASALFGLHPLGVESAAWVYELKTPLSLALSLASFHAWVAFEEGGRRKGAALAASLVLFALALLAKSSAVVLPAFLVLARAIPGRSVSTESRRALVPFAILALAMAAVTLASEPILEAGAAPAGFRERCAVAGHALSFYAGKLLLPLGLSFAYPRLDPRTASLLPAAIAAAAIGAALAAAMLASGRLRATGLAALGFAAALGPVLGFFDIYMMRYAFVADHLAYPAVAAAAVAGGAALARPPARPAALAILLLFGAVTFARAATFSSNEALWREAARREPRAWLAQLELGLVERSLGNTEAAIERFRLALAERESVDALVNLGNALVAGGRAAEALPPLSRAIEIAPEDGLNHANLAAALIALGRVDEALAAYRLARHLAPDDPIVRRNLEALESAKRSLEPGAPR